MSDKRWYLVSYDIRNQKRWRLLYKQLQGRGERIHYSLFRCRLTPTEMEKLIAVEDDLMFVHLCPRCANRVQERNGINGWEPPTDGFEVL